MMAPLADSEPYRISVADYLAANYSERTELVEGIVYEVSPSNGPHRHAVVMLGEQLTVALHATLIVQSENAVFVDGWTGKNAPEVDIAIVERRYYETGPTGAETRACIEVSDTTYRDDRRVKIPMYVAAGIPSWIVNIRERRVEAYATVEDLALPHGRVARDGETFTILGTTIAVSSILPPPRANGADDTSA